MGFRKPLQFLQPEDFWFSAPKKGVIVIHQKKKEKKKRGVMVFASPGEPGPQKITLLLCFSDMKLKFI
jgi:hypothetical protein